MQNLLTNFRTEFLDRLLDILWRQWTTLGVSGRGPTWTGATIDPDALLLLSCTIARHDARLFDAVLEWLRINGRFVNIQRVKRMLKEETFRGLDWSQKGSGGLTMKTTLRLKVRSTT